MEIQHYLDKQKAIQCAFLRFISNNLNIEENYQNLKNLIDDQKYQCTPNELQAILYLILKISNNHNRTPFFFDTIEKILLYIKANIKRTFTNYQIFAIFKSNKRILLFLIKQKILNLDEHIVKSMAKGKFLRYNYLSYFFPEIKTFLEEEKRKELEESIDFDKYEEKRIIGENDSYICELIRKDLIDKFISYVNQKCISLNTTIESSIFETNSLLLKKECSLIEYSAFFGSIQIFKYLFLNGSFINSSFWIYVIHGDDPEMIHFLEDKKFDLNEKTIKKIYMESIKCHHNEIVAYVDENYFINIQEDIDKNIFGQSIRFYNYFYFPDDLYSILYFKYLCHYNYITLIECYMSLFSNDIFKQIKSSSLNIAASKGNIEIINILLNNENDDISKYIFKSSKSLKQVNILSSITCITNSAFKDCCLLNQITIPSSVKLIGKYAFKGCSNLTNILIPPSVIKIGDYAFQDCSSLTEILIPSTVTKIGKYSFCGCSSLEQIYISPLVNEIEKNTFSGCSSLKSVSIPISISFIGDYAFSGCLSMKEILIPSSVKLIGNYAFSVCSSLLNIDIPSSVSFIGDYAFRGCSSLNKVTISSSVTSIGEDVFRGCSSIEEIEIPSSVTSIGDFSFRGCKSLKQIIIPPSVNSIGKDAFKDCKALKKIIIPSSVLFIGNDAFKGCNTLRQIALPSSLESIAQFGIRQKAKIIKT